MTHPHFHYLHPQLTSVVEAADGCDEGVVGGWKGDVVVVVVVAGVDVDYDGGGGERHERGGGGGDGERVGPVVKQRRIDWWPCWGS